MVKQVNKRDTENNYPDVLELTIEEEIIYSFHPKMIVLPAGVDILLN